MSIFESAKNINYARGDDIPIEFTIEDNSVAQDVTGFTFEFAVNTERNPTDASNEQFRLTAVLTDPSNGVIEFRPSTVNTDLAPAVYYYDLQQIDTGGFKHTLHKSTFTISQDINKT